ncbi:TPA: hypothetical protein PXJ50_004365 [Yersinia enterocolitica]|nr:hypothetical protein [Yersinia enterocolitica]HDL6597929.1 hypothetical protein [Yersinia enterocolitica]HDL6670881.1 hypothetical protein [Yersinia enterocolitica]HDL6726718.1 hypothetical protein [Yersinia enterocolitica]HDL6735820.1 hypothetical protein [Yersinia enterocolitica]
MRNTNGEAPVLLTGAAGSSRRDEISRVAARAVRQREALSTARAAPVRGGGFEASTVELKVRNDGE